MDCIRDSWSDDFLNTLGDRGGGIGERSRSSSDETFAVPQPAFHEMRKRPAERGRSPPDPPVASLLATG